MTDKPKSESKQEPTPKQKPMPLNVLRAHSREWLAKRCELLQNSIIEMGGNV